MATVADSKAMDRVEIHLKYEGPDVDSGTMALQDVIPVLQGFAGAYATLAATENSHSAHRIKISAVKRGSADIVLEVWNAIAEHADPISSVAGILTMGVSAFAILKKIFGVAKIKTHVGDGPSTEKISVENGIVISNSQNVEIIVPRETYEIYKDGKLDRDLERLTRPLEPGRIDSAEFEISSREGESLRHRITAEDRPHFEIDDLAVTSTQEMKIVAKLNSLTKSTNSGYLHLQNEKRVFYRYIGDDQTKLHTIFGSYDGPIIIQCKAHMDDRLEVVSLDVYQIERMQGELFNS